jgi:hypothetical protein
VLFAEILARENREISAVVLAEVLARKKQEIGAQ